MNKIIGIDPGSKVLGWAVIETSTNANGFALVGSGIISCSSTSPFHDRMCTICNSLSSKISEFLPSEASVEEVFINKNPRSSMNLVQLRGAVLYILRNSGMKIYEYSPAFVKKSMTTSGSSSKAVVSSMLSAYGIKAASYDESDAIALALCHKYNKTEPNIHQLG